MMISDGDNFHRQLFTSSVFVFVSKMIGMVERKNLLSFKSSIMNPMTQKVNIFMSELIRLHMCTFTLA